MRLAHRRASRREGRERRAGRALMSFEIALSGLRRYRLRTALSLFGLAIGVGALLVTVAIGNGAHRSIQDQIRAAGLNVIVVKAGNYKTKGDDIIEVQD